MKWHIFIAKDNLITFSLAFSSICYISQLFTVSLNLNHKSIRTIKNVKGSVPERLISYLSFDNEQKNNFYQEWSSFLVSRTNGIVSDVKVSS